MQDLAPQIVAVVNYSATGDIRNVIANACVFSFMCVVTYTCFNLGQAMERKLGTNGIRVVTQLMGLILAVIGAQMMLAAGSVRPRSTLSLRAEREKLR